MFCQKPASILFAGDQASFYFASADLKPGQVLPVNFVLTDTATNVTQGQIRGFCIGVAE